jgi:hypothetical protein
VHEINLFTAVTTKFESLSFNNKAVSRDTLNNSFHNRNHKGLIRYYVANEDSLQVSLSVNRDTPLQFEVLEYSYDLINHPKFTITKRPKHTMPKPFVNTDAIVIKRSFNIDNLPIQQKDTLIEISHTNE